MAANWSGFGTDEPHPPVLFFGILPADPANMFNGVPACKILSYKSALTTPETEQANNVMLLS
jgi:hypothetical protein